MGRGLPVLGVEPDARMAEVARRHQVPVEVASFESWEPAGRTYDLLTAGHSWHWVDPAIGLAKAASLVVPGGTVALFWNYHVVEQAQLADFEAVYRAHAPELTAVGRDPTGSQDTDPFEGSADFRSLGSADLPLAARAGRRRMDIDARDLQRPRTTGGAATQRATEGAAQGHRSGRWTGPERVRHLRVDGAATEAWTATLPRVARPRSCRSTR